jgi:hypothetical protein
VREYSLAQLRVLSPSWHRCICGRFIVALCSVLHRCAALCGSLSVPLTDGNMALRRTDCGINTTAARVRVAIYRAALATTLSAVGNVDAAHVHADAAATRLSAALTGVADRVAALVS